MSRKLRIQSKQLAENLRDTQPAAITPANQETKSETSVPKVIVRPAITKSEWGFGSWSSVAKNFKNVSTGGYSGICSVKTPCESWN